MTPRPHTQKRAYWWCQLGGWGLWSAFGTVLYLLVGLDATPLDLVLMFIGTIGPGIAITHAYRAYLRAHGWTELPLRRLAPRVLGAVVLISAAWNVVQIGLVQIGLLPEVAGDASMLYDPADLVLALAGGSMILLIWSILYLGIHYFWSYRQAEIDRLEMEVQSRDAKLDALKLQLNPHFLFNSLNSVRALVTEDPEQAKTMITRLARLLRTTLKSSKTVTVPLRKELALVRTYLELEAVRLEERLAYRIDAPPEVHSQPVPPMLVQTLVENAIKHGIATRTEGGVVRVDARLKHDALQLRVTNTGQLCDDDETGGVGLQNVRERLHLLFGDDAALTLQMDGPESVLAEARLPLRATATDGDALPPPNPGGRPPSVAPAAPRPPAL